MTDKQKMKLENGREYRALTLAASDDESLVVEGYATVFDKPYLLWSYDDFEFYEVIDRHAFDECDMSDVIMQYDHEGRVFARLRNNTLKLLIDDIGLKVIAELGGTDIGKQLYQEIKGGYTDKMSFGFYVGEDRKLEETLPDGKTRVTRTITKIEKLYDVSAVSIPANDMTSISARKYTDGAIEGIKAERLSRENKRKKLKLLLEI